MQHFHVFPCLLALLIVLLMIPESAYAFDEFGEELAPTRFELTIDDLALQIKGRGRIGLHDLQGQGGPEFDSKTDTQTIGTRSPFVELDSFDLAFRFHWDQMLWINASADFTASGAYLSSIYFEYDDELPYNFSQAFEVGYQTSVVATHRHTTRYPLIAAMYWKNPEFHIAYAVSQRFTPETKLTLYADLSMMRPLKSEPLHNSPTYRGTYSLISYGSARSFSGNMPAGTLRLQFTTYGFLLEGFGFLGELSTQSGIDTLVSDIPYYRQMPGYLPDKASGKAWWAGGRIGYDGYGVHFLAEAIYSQEDLLDRFGWYAQASYTYPRESQWFNRFELLFRYEQIYLLNSDIPLNASNALRSPDIINAITWNYDIATIALHANIFRDFVSIRLEYAFIMEENGVDALGIDSVSVDNNELLLQLEARF